MKIKIGKINFRKAAVEKDKPEEKKTGKTKTARLKLPKAGGSGIKFKGGRLTIGRKIIFGFLAVVAIFSLSTVYTYNTVISLNKGYDKLIKESTESVILAEGMKADALEKVLALNEFIISGDKNDLEKVDEHETSFNEGRYYLEKLLDTEETKKALAELSNANTEYNSMVEEIKALVENKEDAKVLELVNGRGAQVVENIILGADTIVRLEEGILNKGVEEQNLKGQSIVASLLTMTIITVIVSIIL
ncbi:MAG TPA: MCP four helix bundle domain-containing protein, partial [Clostridia bacterium]|nr:MCP four helix bundle domain-containing protein [Clostridia bacterium]